MIETRELAFQPPICLASNIVITHTLLFCIDVFLEFEQKRHSCNSKSPTANGKRLLPVSQVDIGKLKGEDKYKAVDMPPSTFACCYSDEESENEEER